jgi:hypothetical protein
MAIKNTQPDLLYVRSREDLLQYEDARMNSLLQAMANFYTTRNDQSTWGNFLRALAIELAKLDYAYSYDIVNSNPGYLTPPDIKRRWADPLYVSSNWPSPAQFDLAYKAMLVELIAAYRQGSTVAGIQAVIFAYTGINIQVQELYKDIGDGVFDQSDRNSIKVSVSVGANSLDQVTSLTQLQQIVQSLYGAIDLAKPAHVGLEFTTIFGADENIDCFISPAFVTQQQYATLTAAQQALYSLTGYALVNPPVFWEASTPTSNPVGLNTLLRDSNGNLQLATVAGVPGTSVPAWGMVSAVPTTDGGVTWTNISPAVSFLSLANGILTVTMGAGPFTPAFPKGQKVALTNLAGSFAVLNGQPLTVISSTPTTFTAAFAGAVVLSPPVSPPLSPPVSGPQAQGTVAYIPPSAVNPSAFKALPSALRLLYQQQYTNSNCSSTGINDTLRIFVRQVEASPQAPMLIQAPVLDIANPTTTVGAWGVLLAPTLSASQWAALPSIGFTVSNTAADGANATYTFNALAGGTAGAQLHEGMRVTIAGTTNGTRTLALTQAAPSVSQNNAVYTGTVTGGANNAFAGLTFTVSGFQTSSNNGSFPCVASNATMLVLANGASIMEIHAASAVARPFDATGKIQNVKLALSPPQKPSSGTFQIALAQTVAPAPEGAAAGLVTPTLQSAYALRGGQYVILQDASLAPLNSPALVPPPRWIGVVDQLQSPPAGFQLTGEVANWDITHPAGLVAPRLDQVWEITTDESFVFGL